MFLHENKKSIIKLVLEASSWSSLYLKAGDLKSSLRSPSLNPNEELWDYVTPDWRKQKIVSKLSKKRADLINSSKIKLENNVNGRILCFYPEISLKDAVVCMASSGFIDQDDSPPWDTWIYYSMEDIEKYHDEECTCLFSWVPGSLVDTINQAIEEDTYDCLIWAEQLEKELTCVTFGKS